MTRPFGHKRTHRLIAACITSAIVGFFGFAHYGFAEPQPSAQATSTPVTQTESNTPSNLEQMQQAILQQLTGDHQNARALRSRAAHNWVLELDAKYEADISVTHLDSGRLYRAVFNAAGDSMGISAVWLSIPKGDSPPSAIIIRNHNRRAGWLAMTEHKPVKPLYVVETVTCQSKTIIAESRRPLPPQALHSLAKARALKALKTPESTAAINGACHNLRHMLPSSGIAQTASLK